MKKIVRSAIAAIFLIGILLLGRNQMAWAGTLPNQNHAAVAQNQGVYALADFHHRKPGSVKPPPVVIPPIHKPGRYSLGGVCIIVVERLVDTVSLNASLLPFSSIRDRPKETERYLAGVCDLEYIKAQKGLPDLAPEDGSVKICFASIPNTANKIYVYDDNHWFALKTTLDNGLACAPASKTGKYVLAKMHQ